MTKSKKYRIFFIASLAAFALFLGLTVWGFVGAGQRSGESLPEPGMKVVNYQFDGNVRYIATDDWKLAAYEGEEQMWKVDVTNRVNELIVTEDYLVVGYNTARSVDVFDKSGKLVNTLSVPYEVLSVDADGDNLFIAAKKGGLGGSVVYYYPNYQSSDAGFMTSLSNNTIADIRINPEDGVLFAATSDYRIHRAAPMGAALAFEQFAVIDYQPLVLGFTDGKVAVADTEGNLMVFTDGKSEKTYRLGMSLCAGEISNAADKAVLVNISGKAGYIDLISGKVIRLSAPYEVQKVAISETGTAALSEFDTFTTAFADFNRLGLISFLTWGRILFLVLAVLSVPFAVSGFFAIEEGRRKKLNSFLTRLRVGLRKNFKSYAFILPTFVLLIMFMYVPAIWGLFLSFFEYVPGVKSRPVGFANFVAAFQDPYFTMGIGNMVIFLVTDLIKALLPAVIIAELIFALNSKRLQYWMRLLLYIPGILPGVAVLLIWQKGIYGDMGLLNSIAKALGGQAQNWLGDPKTALMSLIMIGLPWVGQYILFYGALMSIPESLKESARLDGCNWVRTVIYIDFPMIKSQLKYVFIITFITSIQDFGRVYLTTGFNNDATYIPALQIYRTLMQTNDYGKAAAMGLVLFIVVFGATLANLKAQKADNNF